MLTLRHIIITEPLKHTQMDVVASEDITNTYNQLH